MRLFDALFGRTRLPKPKTEGVFSLITAEVGIKDALGWEPAGRAALCLKPLGTRDFALAGKELEELIRLIGGESGTEIKAKSDDLGYEWLIFSDTDFEDLVGVVHVAGKELHEKGYGGQLLAAVFRFRSDKDLSPYLIYSYKRGAFYPFIPQAGHRRDHAKELSAAGLLERELPIEKDHSRWYPLWDLPV